MSVNFTDCFQNVADSGRARCFIEIRKRDKAAFSINVEYSICRRALHRILSELQEIPDNCWRLVNFPQIIRKSLNLLKRIRYKGSFRRDRGCSAKKQTPTTVHHGTRKYDTKKNCTLIFETGNIKIEKQKQERLITFDNFAESGLGG